MIRRPFFASDDPYGQRVRLFGVLSGFPLYYPGPCALPFRFLVFMIATGSSRLKHGQPETPLYVLRVIEGVGEVLGEKGYSEAGYSAEHYGKSNVEEYLRFCRVLAAAAQASAMLMLTICSLSMALRHSRLFRLLNVKLVVFLVDFQVALQFREPHLGAVDPRQLLLVFRHVLVEACLFCPEGLEGVVYGKQAPSRDRSFPAVARNCSVSAISRLTETTSWFCFCILVEKVGLFRPELRQFGPGIARAIRVELCFLSDTGPCLPSQAAWS